MRNFDNRMVLPDIYQINFGSTGGAWKAAHRISNAIEAEGFHSRAINIHNSQEFQSNITYKIGSKLDYEINQRCVTPSTTSYFSSAGASKFLLEALDKISLDAVINLHWIPGTLTKDVLTSLSKRKVVFTLHDMRYLTGYCHHSGVCFGYQSQCQSCPQAPRSLQSRIEGRFSRYMKNFGLLSNYTLITPSVWLTDICVKSAVGEKLKTFHINNPLPDHVFNLKHKKERQPNHGPMKICIPGAQNPAKGGREALDVLERIRNALGFQIETYVLGDLHDGFAGITQHSIEQTNDDYIFSKKLSEMDVLFHLSTFENSPNLIREAQALGVAVISSNAGGSAELIYNSTTGLITNGSNLEEIVAFLKKNNEARATVAFLEAFVPPKNFAEASIANEYLMVYGDLVKNSG